VAAYSASRFALEGFAESLSQEVEPLGIYVSIVEPGISKTEQWTPARGAGARVRDPNSPYAAWYAEVERLFARAMESSPTTAAGVARTVHAIMSARRPRLRYVVGYRAALLIALRRHLPGELFERLYFSAVMRRISGS
jgi:NAD(P)-dependent dehydrogenase (short-subunit alcohol dehydrogenase family)